MASDAQSHRSTSRAAILGPLALMFGLTSLLLNQAPVRAHAAGPSVVPVAVPHAAALPTRSTGIAVRASGSVPPMSAFPSAAATEGRAAAASAPVPNGWTFGAVALAAAAAGLWFSLRSKAPAVSPIAVFAATSGPAGYSLAIAEADLAKQPDGQANVTVDGTDLLLVKEGSKIYAVQARCAHLPLKLKGSKVSNGVLTCSKHGSTFSCATGKCQDWLPGEGMNNVLRLASSQPKSLMAYATKVTGGNVYVNVKQQVAMMATSGEKDGSWTFVATEAELDRQPNRQLRSTINGVDVLVAKDGTTIYAMQARCAHLPLRLQGSKLENGVITCSKHGSKFDCATGAAVEWLPGGGFNDVLRLASPDASGLKVYRTKVADGKIFVSVA